MSREKHFTKGLRPTNVLKTFEKNSCAEVAFVNVTMLWIYISLGLLNIQASVSLLPCIQSQIAMSHSEKNANSRQL